MEILSIPFSLAGVGFSQFQAGKAFFGGLPCSSDTTDKLRSMFFKDVLFSVLVQFSSSPLC